MRYNNWQGNRFPLFSLFLFIALFSSCMEGDDESTPQKSYLLFLNGYNASPSVNFLANGTRFPDGSLARGYASLYNQVYSGSWDLSVIPSGGSVSDPLDQLKADLSPERYYTCILGTPDGSASMLLEEDDLTSPASGSANVRFINLFSEAGPVDFGIKDSTALFSSLNYFDKSDFAAISTDTVRMVLFPAGNVTDTIAAFDFRAASRGIYTFYIAPSGDSVLVSNIDHSR